MVYGLGKKFSQYHKRSYTKGRSLRAKKKFSVQKKNFHVKKKNSRSKKTVSEKEKFSQHYNNSHSKRNFLTIP